MPFCERLMIQLISILLTVTLIGTMWHVIQEDQDFFPVVWTQ
jgi:hypothetical protein